MTDRQAGHGGAVPRFRAGFTLLEVVVAITIGGLAVSAAVALLVGLTGHADAIEETAAWMDRDANVERLLRSLVRNFDLQAGDLPRLVGDSRGVRFRSWCQSPGEPAEICSVHLFFHAVGSEEALSVEIQTPGTVGTGAWAEPHVVRLRTGFDHGGLLYLADAATGGTWRNLWSERVSPPALAVVVDADTLILPVR